MAKTITVYEVRATDPESFDDYMELYSGPTFFLDPDVAVDQAIEILPQHGDIVDVPPHPLQVVCKTVTGPFDEDKIIELLNQIDCFDSEDRYCVVTAIAKGSHERGYYEIQDHSVELED